MNKLRNTKLAAWTMAAAMLLNTGSLAVWGEGEGSPQDSDKISQVRCTCEVLCTEEAIKASCKACTELDVDLTVVCLAGDSLPGAQNRVGDYSATAGYKSVTVKWVKDSGNHYTVYRGETETDLTEVAADLTTDTYEDTNVDIGKQYWYRVDTKPRLREAVTTGTPFQTDYATGWEALQANAVYHQAFTGSERRFDGTRTFTGTSEELNELLQVNKGSIIIKARSTSTDTGGMNMLFGIGNSSANSRKSLGVGITNSNNVLRYELCDGLYSSASKANYGDTEWHTIVLTSGEAYVNVTIDGVSGTTGSEGYYSNASFNGLFTRTEGADSLTIGGIQGVTSNTNGLAYKNWVGEIASVTVTKEVLMQSDAEALTIDRASPLITLSNHAVGAGEEGEVAIGTTVGDFTVTGTGADAANLVLMADQGDNDKFVLEGKTLKTAAPLQLGQRYIVTVDSQVNDGEQNFAINVGIGLDGAVIVLDKPVYYFPSMDGSKPTVPTDAVDKLKASTSITATAQIVSTGKTSDTIFSLSDGVSGKSYMTFFAEGTNLGWQIFGLPSGMQSVSVPALRENELNTVALKYDSSDYTVKLFANGKLVNTKQYSEASFPKVSALPNLNTATVGARVRFSGVGDSPFHGLIGGLTVYNKPPMDDALIKYTSITPAEYPKQEVKEPIESDQPFRANDDFGSKYFRIPALYTLQDGRIMAAADIRFGSTFDSPNNLDTGIRIKENGQWGRAQLVNYFADYTNEPGRQANSASFIDPVLVQTESGRIIILVDAFPGGSGLFGTIGNHTGMHMVNGEYYMGLTMETGANDTKDWSKFTHYLKPNPAPTGENDKYLVLKMSDDSATQYTTDGHFNLYQNGTLQTVEQKGTGANGNRVPMSVFYRDSTFKLFSTSYLWIIYSDDGGDTWSDPIIAGNQERHPREQFLGAGPGRGHVVQNGPYAGRILFCVYDTNKQVSGNAVEIASTVYSDDDGLTWHNGNRTRFPAGNSALKSSEAQIIEFPDGTLRMYARSGGNYIVYGDSTDGGINWTMMQQDKNLQYNGGASNGCEISVINYSQPIDGKPALILSSPGGSSSRTDGIIRIGLIEGSEGNYSVNWKYKYNVSYGGYAYSSLTELPGGGIGLLSEDGGDGIINYREFSLAELMNSTTVLQGFGIQSAFTAGAPFTVELKLGFMLEEKLSNLTHLNISYPGSGLSGGQVALSGISDDKKTVTFTGTFPSSNANNYSYEISLPPQTRVVALPGMITSAEIGTLTGTVAKGGGGSSGGGGGSSGGGGGGGGGGRIIPGKSPATVTTPFAKQPLTSASAIKETESAVKQALVQAQSNNVKNVNVPIVIPNIKSVSPGVLKDILSSTAKASEGTGLKITPMLYLDTVFGKQVTGRLYIDPSKSTLTTDIFAGIATDNPKVRAAFEKQFSNQMEFVSFDHAGSFGMTVNVAVKINLSKLNPATMRLYSYNPKTNTYRDITATAKPYIDGNGYLRFTTTTGDCVVVSNGALTVK